ncbi:FMN-binding protein [Aliikangiella sp. IMCC44359]|uniref:FMN-binding protein n=1 Tax=Aliikangiella sp. IMCC44359 TaxID=3459125 RepID=UPI00403A87B3
MQHPTTLAKTYMSQKDFLNIAFPKTPQITPPEAKVLWLNDSIQQKIIKILHHPYPKLRIRYWKSSQRTVWFLDEIGKERPISFAVQIEKDRIQQMKVLAFRESRGDEIRMQAFTQQFDNIKLDEGGQLSRHIDGITGATMSVAAMKKIARVALMLAKLVD